MSISYIAEADKFQAIVEVRRLIFIKFTVGTGLCHISSIPDLCHISSIHDSYCNIYEKYSV